MTYYEVSLEAIENDLRALANELKIEIGPVEDPNAQDVPEVMNNLLFMVYRIRSMDTQSLEAALKAGRWVGWMFRDIQELYRRLGKGDWDNTRARDIARADRDMQADRPEYLRCK